MVTSSKPIPTKKSNPCPVCGDVKGDCRTFDDRDLALCMKSDTAPAGWIDLGRTKCETWRQFAPKEDTDFDRAEWQRRKQQEKTVEIPQTMSLEERDRFYRNWLANGSLNDQHRADLERRGVTDFSIAISSPFGYAIPFKSLQDKYVGAQWRLDDPGDGGRYRWHNLPVGKHYPGTDELPIAVYPVENPNGIVLVEGTGVKPLLASKRLEMIAIGVAGGNYTKAILQIKAVFEAFPDLPVLIVPDAGDVVNPQVMRRLERAIEALQPLGIKPEFLWWEQLTKEENDIDEATEAEIKSARRLSWEEFKLLQPIDSEASDEQSESDRCEIPQILLDRYQELFTNSESIEQFIFAMPGEIKNLETHLQGDSVQALLQLAVNAKLDQIECDRLITEIVKATKIAKKTLKDALAAIRFESTREEREQERARRREQAEQRAKQREREHREKYQDRPYIPIRYSKRGEVELPKAGEVANILSEFYNETLAWNPKLKSFFRYGAELDGLWSAAIEESVMAMIQSDLDINGASGNYGAEFISSIFRLMRNKMSIGVWDSPESLIPFTNGVLELDTGELLPHDPEYRFLWQMPRDHNPLAKSWDKIGAWLNEATMGDEHGKHLLLCFANAVLKGRYDLQKFLNLTGKPGSGKGTYSNLIVSLIGEQNVHSTNLDVFCGNQFDQINALGKRLVLFADEDLYPGNPGNFKKLTGGDQLRGEDKGLKAFNFQYTGMTLVCSNHPVFPRNPAIERRIILYPFELQTTSEQRRDLQAEFREELAAFTNAALAIPDEVVSDTLRQVSGVTGAMADLSWDYKLRTDAVLQWVHDCLVYAENDRVPVGSDKDDQTSLYGHYYQYSVRTGSKPKSYKTFSGDLEEALSALNLPIEKKRSNSGQAWLGVSFRAIGSQLPSLIDVARAKEKRLDTPTELEAVEPPEEKTPFDPDPPAQTTFTQQEEAEITDAIDMANDAAASGDPETIQNILSVLATSSDFLKQQAWARMPAQTRIALRAVKTETKQQLELAS